MKEKSKAPLLAKEARNGAPGYCAEKCLSRDDALHFFVAGFDARNSWTRRSKSCSPMRGKARGLFLPSLRDLEFASPSTKTAQMFR
jgi:hypothetical protein